MHSNEELITALTKWMEDKNLSSRKVAALLNVSKSAVGRWLNGSKIRESNKDDLLPHIQKYLHSEEAENEIPHEIRDAYELLKKSC